MDNVFELAKRFKKPASEIRKNLDYQRKHPYDTLQPSDKMFHKVWGKKLRKDKEFNV